MKAIKTFSKLCCIISILLLTNNVNAQFVRLQQLERSQDSLHTVRTDGNNIQRYTVDTMYFDNDTLYMDVLFLPDSTLVTVHAVEITTGGSGTVTSVGISGEQFNITGSPVTTSGVIDLELKNQAVKFNNIQHISANRILGRSSGTGTGEIQQLLPLAPVTVSGSVVSLTQNTNRLLGRTAAGAGVTQEISVSAPLTLSGGVLSSTAGSGTVTSVGLTSTDLSVSGSPITTSGNITANINNNAVTTAKIANNAVTTAKINNQAVTYSKIQNVTFGRLLGRHSSGSGTVQEIQIGSGLSLNISTGVLSADGASNWTLSSGNLYPNSTSTNVVVGATTNPSASYSLYNNGIFYNSSESYYDGVLNLSATGRGSVNIRNNETGVNGGIAFFSQSTPTQGFTSIYDSKIFGRIDPKSNGMRITGISNNEGDSPLILEGLQSNTLSRFSATVTISGSKRSGTGKTSLSGSDTLFELQNNGSTMMSASGTVIGFSAPVQLPSWTTATRPTGSDLNNGIIGYNITTQKIEAYAGSTWVDLH